MLFEIIFQITCLFSDSFTIIQRISTMDKRASKPKTQYSPSEPSATTMYHLVVSSETGNLTIVGNSSVKRLSNDGFITLNDGRQGRLIISGK